MVVDPLRGGAVSLPGSVQGAQRFLLLGVDAQHRHATRPGEAPQRGDMAKLLVTRLGINLAGDQLLAQGPSPKAGLCQQSRRRVATDRHAQDHQFLGQLHGLQIGPTHPRIGRTPRTVGLQHLAERLAQDRFVFIERRSTAAGTPDARGAPTRALRMIGVAVAHLFQLANPGIERAPTHPQHPGDIGDPAEANLQCLNRGVAAAMVLRQRPAIQSHRFFVGGLVTGKLVHGRDWVSKYPAPMVAGRSQFFK